MTKMPCAKCNTETSFSEGDGIDCTECKKWFCDNCYDTGKGDGCHCHVLESREQPTLKRKIWGSLAEFLVNNVRAGHMLYSRSIVVQGLVTVNGDVVRNPDYPVRVGDLVVRQKTTYVVPE